MEQSEMEEMEKMKDDFVRSGYKREELDEIERKARELSQRNRDREESDVLTFPLFFFDKINSSKTILKDSEADLRTIIGDTKIIMAVKKNPAVGNAVIKNKGLSSNEEDLDSQKCGAPNCLQCPLVNTDNTTTVNNFRVRSSEKRSCKSRNIIYSWQCKICLEENGEQFKNHTREQIPIEDVFRKKNGKTLHFPCIPAQSTKITFLSQTLKLLWSKSVPRKTLEERNLSI